MDSMAGAVFCVMSSGIHSGRGHICGSIIGAGFASGQEIMQFFSAYKTGGFWDIAGRHFSAQ